VCTTWAFAASRPSALTASKAHSRIAPACPHVSDADFARSRADSGSRLTENKTVEKNLFVDNVVRRLPGNRGPPDGRQRYVADDAPRRRRRPIDELHPATLTYENVACVSPTHVCVGTRRLLDRHDLVYLRWRRFPRAVYGARIARVLLMACFPAPCRSRPRTRAPSRFRIRS